MSTMSTSPSLAAAIWRWWKEGQARHGFWSTARSLAIEIGQFLRESTPAHRRLRYGGAQYDWDHHVDTTSATVGWRERLLGHFHLPYQATEPALFTQMMAGLKIDFREFTFIDIGSGKGRVLMMAADYPFHRILGVELLPALHRVAQKNLGFYKSDSQQCFALEAVRGDACKLIFPAEPAVVYLFNPLTESELIEVMTNLDNSLSQSPRAVYLLYHNPVLEHVIANHPAFNKIAGTHQYSVFRKSV
jgi:hypothetical protein